MADYLPELEPWSIDYAGRLPVSELFYTVQGEGRWSGAPSVFVRLMFCNVGCAWCDTRYTWDPERLDEPDMALPSDVVRRCTDLVPPDAMSGNPPHVIVSGGEPLLHQDRLPGLIADLRAAGFGMVEVETSGTIMPSRELLDAVDWWNCSPKLASSRIPPEGRIFPDTLRAMAETELADFLFVVRDEADVEEIERDYGGLVPTDRVWLMPEGASVDRQLHHSREVVELCLAKGYRLGLRSHIFFWGNERGR